MNYLNRLNHNQLAAAQWDGGPLLVLAGPGSGKTATLTARVARLVEQSRGEPFRILCLTFTRKAASEMRERLLSLAPDANSRVLLTTFHAFAIDILQQHGSHFGFTPDFEVIEHAEQIRIVQLIIDDEDNSLTRFISAEKSLKAIEFLLRNFTLDDSIADLLQDAEVGQQLKTLFIQYKNFLKQQNCLDYGAILYFCAQLLCERPRISKQLRTVYSYICVDEFQDTNLAQYRLLRALAPEKNSNIFIVGDDDQVIYQWNGASPRRIDDVKNDYDLTTIQLPENYRCPPEVVSLANSLIGHNTERSMEKKPLLSMKIVENIKCIALIEFESGEKEAEGIASRISTRLQSGIHPRDIVVLARTTKLLEGVLQALNKISIPCHVQRRKSHFESAPLRFISSLLKLALVRSDDYLATTVTQALFDCVEQKSDYIDLNEFSTAFDGDQLEAFGELLNNKNSIPQALRESVALLIKGQYANFIQTALVYFDSVERLGRSDGTEQYTEYETERKVWDSILHEIGGESHAYSLSLAHFLREITLANKAPEAPSTAIRCLTIHSSKGLEFKHVYLIGMAEDQLPSFQSKKIGDESREMQEERRSCFVAITRTIETLTMSYGQKYNGWRKQPSRFLTEMGLLER